MPTSDDGTARPNSCAYRCRYSPSPASRPKFEIDAGFDLLYIQRSIRAVSRSRRRGQIQGLVAKAEIVVLDPGGPIRRERIFKSGAGGPTGPRQACSRGVAESVIETVLVVRKGDAALGIDQQPVERGADASGYRRRPLGVGVDGVGERIVSAALEPSPVEIAFDAEHQRVDLPIGADLTAADKAGLVEGVIRAGKRVAPRGVGKAGAEIAADINSRPIVNRRRIGDRRHRRRSARRRQIRGLRRTNAKASRNANRNN